MSLELQFAESEAKILLESLMAQSNNCSTCARRQMTKTRSRTPAMIWWSSGSY
jgi:hypothetical protein